MVDYFTGDRPWWQLYDFLEELPSWGHYKSALALDEDWAKSVLDAVADGRTVPAASDPEHMTPLHYTPEVSYLAAMLDALQSVRNAVIETSGNDSPPFEPVPRPKTAVDVERERRVIAELYDIDRMILGG